MDSRHPLALRLLILLHESRTKINLNQHYKFIYMFACMNIGRKIQRQDNTLHLQKDRNSSRLMFPMEGGRGPVKLFSSVDSITYTMITHLSIDT